MYERRSCSRQLRKSCGGLVNRGPRGKHSYGGKRSWEGVVPPPFPRAIPPIDTQARSSSDPRLSPRPASFVHSQSSVGEAGVHHDSFRRCGGGVTSHRPECLRCAKVVTCQEGAGRSKVEGKGASGWRGMIRRLERSTTHSAGPASSRSRQVDARHHARPIGPVTIINTYDSRTGVVDEARPCLACISSHSACDHRQVCFSATCGLAHAGLIKPAQWLILELDTLRAARSK